VCAGFACCLVPGSASGQARCAQPLVLSHIRGLLAGRSETEAEAQEVVAEGGVDPEPKRATGAVRREVPRTAASDAERAPRRTNRVTHDATRIIPVPIRAPFQNVSVHVVKTPWVGRIIADWRSVFEPIVMRLVRPIVIRVAIRIVCVAIQFARDSPKRIGAPRPCPAGVLPLRFRW
jgi:hypothetical protein